MKKLTRKIVLIAMLVTTVLASSADTAFAGFSTSP
jgi:hypothetical protein